MSDTLSLHDLSERLAVLEKRMNIHQATYETAMERLERRMAEYNAESARRNAERDAEAAKRDAEAAKCAVRCDAEAAKRDQGNLRWQIGLWISAMVVIGIMIRWPG